MTRIRLWSAATAVALVGLAGAAVPATAQAAASDKAMVRVAHFSPDAPAVDVYVDGAKALSGVTFPTVSDYLPLPAGKHSFAVRAAGTAASSKPVIDASATVEGGMAYTVAAVGPLAKIKAQVYADDLSAPASGKGKVRVIHAAVGVPAVDVKVKGGPTLFPNLAFPNATDYAAVDAATYPVQVTAAGDSKALLSADLPVKAGTITTVAAIGGAGKAVTLKVISDAAGMGAMPSGGVATGGGGTAAPVSSSNSAGTLTAVGIAAMLLLLFGGTTAAARRSRG